MLIVLCKCLPKYFFKLGFGDIISFIILHLAAFDPIKRTLNFDRKLKLHSDKTASASLTYLLIITSRPFLKTAGGIVLGSVAVSAVSAVSADVLPYISVAIKASFLKLGMCNICKNNIAKMFLDFWKILNCSFDRRF